MLTLKEFYQQKRDLLKMNKDLRVKVFKSVKKLSKKVFRKRKILVKKKESQGILHMKSSLNNTIVALTSLRGKVQFVQSAGSCGFQGKKKRSTKFAIESTLNSVLVAAKEQRVKGIFLCLKGFSKSRHSILKSLKKNDLKLLGIRNMTPNPHNGCRPRKLKRK